MIQIISGFLERISILTRLFKTCHLDFQTFFIIFCEKNMVKKLISVKSIIFSFYQFNYFLRSLKSSWTIISDLFINLRFSIFKPLCINLFWTIVLGKHRSQKENIQIWIHIYLISYCNSYLYLFNSHSKFIFFTNWYSSKQFFLLSSLV